MVVSSDLCSDIASATGLFGHQVSRNDDKCLTMNVASVKAQPEMWKIPAATRPIPIGPAVFPADLFDPDGNFV
jgi:hypothetical protein